MKIIMDQVSILFWLFHIVLFPVMSSTIMMECWRRTIWCFDLIEGVIAVYLVLKVAICISVHQQMGGQQQTGGHFAEICTK